MLFRIEDLGSCTTPLSENPLKNLGGDGGYEVVLGGGDGGVEDCGIVEKLLIRCLGVLTDKLTDRRTLLVIVESLSRPTYLRKTTTNKKYYSRCCRCHGSFVLAFRRAGQITLISKL